LTDGKFPDYEAPLATWAEKLPQSEFFGVNYDGAGD
jgi:hypothetical protein